jgi:predicted kinase
VRRTPTPQVARPLCIPKRRAPAGRPPSLIAGGETHGIPSAPLGHDREVATRPVLIVVTGAPGSGKTTLSALVSERLRLPRVSRDLVRSGLFYSAGGWSNTPDRVPSVEESIEAFFAIVDRYLYLGVSIVTDYILRRDRLADVAFFRDRAECIVVHASTSTATQRYLDRLRGDSLFAKAVASGAIGGPSLDDALEASRVGAEDLGPLLADSSDTGLPTFPVDTTDGYSPEVGQILQFILSEGRAAR